MQKQRNAVERSLLDTTSHIKTLLAQRLYAALGEAGVDRQKALKVLAIANAAVDETYNRFSRPFDKAVDELVSAAREDIAPRKASKSAK